MDTMRPPTAWQVVFRKRGSKDPTLWYRALTFTLRTKTRAEHVKATLEDQVPLFDYKVEKV